MPSESGMITYVETYHREERFVMFVVCGDIETHYCLFVPLHDRGQDFCE